MKRVQSREIKKKTGLGLTSIPESAVLWAKPAGFLLVEPVHPTPGHRSCLFKLGGILLRYNRAGFTPHRIALKALGIDPRKVPRRIGIFLGAACPHDALWSWRTRLLVLMVWPYVEQMLLGQVKIDADLCECLREFFGGVSVHPGSNSSDSPRVRAKPRGEIYKLVLIVKRVSLTFAFTFPCTSHLSANVRVNVSTWWKE